jgi:2-polyprenyl-3-methyl-5-hydroxy-6-metoxy-1,4-benzoquinol methylase
MSDAHHQLIQNYGKQIMQTTHHFSPNEFKRMAKRYAKIFNRHLPTNKAARIVDIGCGDGHFLYYLKSEGYQAIEGVDASDDRLALCRQYVTPNVHCADVIPWLEAHRGQFDVVSCHHVIEHFPGDSVYGFVERLVGAVKPGGQLILTTPNACTPWAGYNLYHDLTHCRLFTSDSLTQMLSLYGLTPAIYPDASVPFDTPSTLRWLAWKVREAWLKLSYRIDIGGTRGNQTTPLIVSPNLLAIGRKPV